MAGTLDLAVADKLCRDNPASSPVITPPHQETGEREPWTAARVWLVHDTFRVYGHATEQTFEQAAWQSTRRCSGCAPWSPAEQ